ncbi:hypothetical protein J7E97_15655 [Streptomyces sp. ISL-66]|uniref:hypothetical protein n=1 Tax=Streptomyces sp. ISL-66 TaxID=2819186 RepID=UPI001BE86E01|nr:hypothetical protein [Streptomyces sp. ISL-66]MBT2469270.1 hypothetical protein [Streptomyces sp. ISL-66]
MAEPAHLSADDLPLALHPLVFLEDGDEVTIGRRDTESYAIFPPDGAALVRRLGEGATPAQAADWYEATYGERADVGDVVEALRELGFVRAEGEAEATAEPVRWQRLGRAVFSPAAWSAYVLLALWALICVVRRPELLPTPDDLVFSHYYAVITLVLFVVAVPLIALHEIFHALAGRRLGIRSRTRMSYRFYFLVVETSLDGLAGVERRKRYLPILAGMVADTVLISLAVIVAGFAGGLTSRVCLAVAFTTFIRLMWQFFLYLRTDIYVLITTVLGCVDLHTTSVRMLANRVNRLLGRTDRLTDESLWHPVDRRAARWYSWLLPIGYVISLSTFVWGVGPVFLDMISASLRRFGAGDGSSWIQLLDAAVFLVLTFGQIAFALWLAARERLRSRRARLHHVIA